MHRADLRGWRPGGNYAAGPFKRAFDLLVASALSVLTLPVVLGLALVSAVAFHAWPFFVQERMGCGGATYRFVKVRSLPTSTPAYTDKFSLAALPSSRWGSLLRKSHLDELPQLWLVVAGRMSLVGPRPEMAAVADTFDPAFVRSRCSVRPGCTGPWQVGTSSHRLIGDDPRFDLLYLDEACLRLDLKVLWWTVAQLFGARPVTFERLCLMVGDPVVVLVGDQFIDLRLASPALLPTSSADIADLATRLPRPA
ncbi:hypothetical protein BH10ACT1_BH10ACT1_35590 [soil metagenome]